MVAAAASDVFLSYSRADAQAVEAVRARLTEAGITASSIGPGCRPASPGSRFSKGARPVRRGRRVPRPAHGLLAAPRGPGRPRPPGPRARLPGHPDPAAGPRRRANRLPQPPDLDRPARRTDDPAQFQNLIAAIHREAKEDAAAIKAAICPYRGLLPFREEDAGFFFGREQEPGPAEQNPAHQVVAVIGRSGSGKSSLVFAGLFPELRKSPGGITWDMMAIRPGPSR